MIEKVISGGQTGVDRLGLEVAKKLNILTGGTAPKDWKTENGSDPSLKDFGLVESNFIGYMPRTQKNVLDSDGTVIYGDVKSPGTKMTIDFLTNAQKPWIANPGMDAFVEFVEKNNIKILNVAGNRASKLSDVKLAEIEALLMFSLTEVNKLIK